MFIRKSRQMENQIIIINITDNNLHSTALVYVIKYDLNNSS